MNLADVNNITPLYRFFLSIYLNRYLWVLFFLVIPAALVSKMLSASDRQHFLSMMSVRKAKVVRAAKEIERKCFHVSGYFLEGSRCGMLPTIGF